MRVIVLSLFVCVCVCVCIDNRAFVTGLETCGFTWIHAHACAAVQVRAKFDGSKGEKSVHNRTQLLARTAALLRIYERRRRLQLHFYHFMTTPPSASMIVVDLQKGISNSTDLTDPTQEPCKTLLKILCSTQHRHLQHSQRRLLPVFFPSQTSPPDVVKASTLVQTHVLCLVTHSKPRGRQCGGDSTNYALLPRFTVNGRASYQVLLMPTPLFYQYVTQEMFTCLKATTKLKKSTTTSLPSQQN